jgi:hypothetical protein
MDTVITDSLGISGTVGVLSSNAGTLCRIDSLVACCVPLYPPHPCLQRRQLRNVTMTIRYLATSPQVPYHVRRLAIEALMLCRLIVRVED